MDKFKLLFEMSPDPIFVENYDGIILAANKAACDMHGIEHEKIVGRNFIEFIPEEHHDYVKSNFETFIKEGKKIIESFAINKTGKIIDIEITANSILFGKERCVLLHIRDISRRKKAEDTAQESQNQLRKLSKHLQNIREIESTKIARDLHDVLGQDLTAMKFELSYIAKKISDFSLSDKTISLIELTNKMLDTIRKIATNLRPTVLDNIGLIPALDWLILDFEAKYDIATIFNNNTSIKFSKNIATAIYRIAQESLTNVSRHAHCNEVIITFSENETFIHLTIKDNGIGFNVESNNDSLGIIGMKERALNIGGVLEINSTLDQGTIIDLKVPIQ